MTERYVYDHAWVKERMRLAGLEGLSIRAPEAT